MGQAWKSHISLFMFLWLEFSLMAVSNCKGRLGNMVCLCVREEEGSISFGEQIAVSVIRGLSKMTVGVAHLHYFMVLKLQIYTLVSPDRL